MREVLFGKKPKEGVSESKIAKELENVSFSRENEKNKENDVNSLSQKEVISSLKSLFKSSEFLEKGS